MRPDASHASLVGRTIAGKFVVESVLGSGAMGAVYRAKQTALDKTVAIKVMHGDLLEDPAFAARFQREAKAASRLDHPNSVRVLDYGQEPDGLLYIAMEYLAGKDLLAVMRDEWPLPGERIIGILMQTLSALHVAHGLGIVHRDLKPENIMILPGVDDEGRPADVVKVCDFGIAKLSNDRSSQVTSTAKGPLTSSGTLVGTPEYMSPEQGRGDALDARSDLYSMGVILFHLLTGRVPFDAENAIGIILKHITDDPPKPTSIAPAVDPRLEAICLRAMRKRPDDRYGSARDMRNDLRAVRDQARGIVRPPDGSSPELSSPSLYTSATVAVPSVDTIGSTTGMSVTAGTRRTRGCMAAAVAVVFVVLGAGVAFLVVPRSRHLPVGTAASLSAPAVDLVPLADPAPLASLAAPDPIAQEAQPMGGQRAPASTRLPVSGHHGARPPSPSSAPVAPRQAPPPVTPVTPAAASAAPSPPDAPAPYDPSAATVDVGSVTPQNVSADAVRAAIRGANLTSCYRDALRARGRRAFGSATLNLSIDEAGRVSGAVLTGADWLPEMIRCVQGSASSAQLRAGAVESGGGTAEVWLSFRAP